MLFKRTLLQGGSSEINKGDKVRVISGDLQSISGTVITIEDGFILMKPNIEGIDENIKINSEHVSKYFEPGDKVKVIDGKYKGETGIVVELENAFAHVVFD
jgi:transcription elongation factor SPT5